MSSFPLTYILGFSCGGVIDNLSHCVHLKRELELLLGFESLPSLCKCVVLCMCLCYVLVLLVNDGWYSRCSNTRSLFTRQQEAWRSVSKQVTRKTRTRTKGHNSQPTWLKTYSDQMCNTSYTDAMEKIAWTSHPLLFQPAIVSNFSRWSS